MSKAKGKGEAIKYIHPIKRRLKEIGMTQRELAVNMGVSVGTVNNWATGRIRLSSGDYSMIVLRKILGIDLNYMHGIYPVEPEKKLPLKEIPPKLLHPVEARLQEIGKDKQWLVEVTGCSKVLINRFLAGREPDPEVLKRARLVLQVSEAYIFGKGVSTKEWDPARLNSKEIVRFKSQPKRIHPISRRLKELGKNQKWLAGEMKMSEQSISNYVNSKIVLCRGDSKTQKLIRILGIDIQYLRTF